MVKLANSAVEEGGLSTFISLAILLPRYYGTGGASEFNYFVGQIESLSLLVDWTDYQRCVACRLNLRGAAASLIDQSQLATHTTDFHFLTSVIAWRFCPEILQGLPPTLPTSFSI